MKDREQGDLARYLRGEDGLSAAYRRLPRVAPPRVVDRQVLERARVAALRRPGRDALAYAASALLALAVLFAFEIHPGGRRTAQDAPHFVRTAMRSDHVGGWRASDPAASRPIDPPRCAPRGTRSPPDAGDSAESPQGFRIAEATSKLREPCSPLGRLR